jgi:hypothetical protein
MRKLQILALLAFSLIFTVTTNSQNLPEADVTHNVNLRVDPSTTKPPIVLLVPPDKVQLLEEQPTNGYYHVRTQDGDEGWVWGKNITIETPEALTAATAPPTGAPASAISDAWDKPIPNKTTFNGGEGSCPWNGNGDDPDEYWRKNRTDVPIAYHDVQWSVIDTLNYPTAPAKRKNWTQEQLAVIQPYEGVAVRAVGYLVAIKPQNGGSGEGTNCHFSQLADVDIHLALAENVGGAERDSIVIEFTPRFYKQHPNWTKQKLQPWLNSDKPVRVSGWLMLDPDHRNHLGKFRNTLWEIHPITKFEVFKNGAFVDLDELP